MTSASWKIRYSDLELRRESIVERALDADHEARSPGNPLREEFQRGDEPAVVQNDGAQFMRQVPQLFGDLIEKSRNPIDPLAPLGRQVARGFGQRDAG